MFTLGIIAIIFILFMLHGAFVNTIKGPSSRAGGNPNAPGSYKPRTTPVIYPPPPKTDNGLRPSPLKWERKDDKRNKKIQSENVYELLKVEAPEHSSSPPRPQVIYLTDNDPTPPYGIPRIE